MVFSKRELYTAVALLAIVFAASGPLPNTVGALVATGTSLALVLFGILLLLALRLAAGLRGRT